MEPLSVRPEPHRHVPGVPTGELTYHCFPPCPPVELPAPGGAGALSRGSCDRRLLCARYEDLPAGGYDEEQGVRSN